MQFIPGYNCSERSMKGHGVHGMEIRWYLRGPAGGAQFALGTGWIPGELSPGHGLGLDGVNRTWMLYPCGVDLGYHARLPQYEGEQPILDDCPIIGGACYYDGSGLRADDVLKRFVVDGESVIWSALEQEYQRLVHEEGEAAAAANGS